MVYSPRLLQEAECSVDLRDVFHISKNTNIEVLGEFRVAVEGRDELGNVDAISHINILNVMKIKELVERMERPKDGKPNPRKMKGYKGVSKLI